MTEFTDNQLLEAIQKGDRKSFRMLVDRYLKRVWKLSYSILYNREDAEDVTQDVFTAVWRHRETLVSDKAAFSTWLYRVAFNRAIDYKRQRKGGHVDIATTEIADAALGIEDRLSLRHTRSRVADTLSQLPERQRDAILLYYYNEMPIGEVSRQLGTTEESARSLLKRGKETLKKHLANDYGSESQ